MNYDYSIGLNREQHGLCTRPSTDLPAALQTWINAAVESVDRIQGVSMLELTDQTLEDGLLLQLGSRLIEFAEAELSAPMTDGTHFTVKQTRSFTGDPFLLEFWPAAYKFAPPVGALHRTGNLQEGYIEVTFSFFEDPMGKPPTKEETEAAFAENDGKLLKLPEWVNPIAKANNERMRQRVAIAVAERRQSQAV